MTEGTASADTSWLESMPEVYDRCLGLATFAPYAADIALRALDVPHDRVLELAAGTGIVTAGLVEALPDADITATDINDAMVTYGSTRVPGPTWRVADAQDLPFADDSFDLVVCQFGVMFLPDRIGAYRGVRRVLSPGGSFLFNVWDTLETHEVEAAVIDVMAELFPDDPPDFLRRVPHGYADPNRIRADVQAGGLTVAELERVELTGRAPSAAVLAEGYCLGTPLRFELQERGDLGDLVPRVSSALARRLGDGLVEGAMSAYVVRAVTRL
jgi:SAM-dependent methyltransferase